MDKLFIPVQGCLLEVVREQYADFYKDKERWRYLKNWTLKTVCCEELSEREIGLRLGVTQSVVNKRKAKILAKLRKIVEN